MDQKNFILAIVLSVLIIVGWQAAFPPAKPPPAPATTQGQTQPGAPPQPGAPQPTVQPTPGAPGVPGVGTGSATAAVDRGQALSLVPRVSFTTPELLGSISLKGARIDDVRLAKHRLELDPKSQAIPVLSPEGAKDPYDAEFGWSAADASIKTPGPDTMWAASRERIAPGEPVRLTWDNGQGLLFAIDLTVDQNFLFTVKQSVENRSDKPVTLFPWALVVRIGEWKTEGFYILHEGPYGVFDGTLKEISPSDLKGGKVQKASTTGGWVGFTDKYWMATLVPDQKTKVDVTIKQTGSGAATRYQIDYINPTGILVAPGATATSSGMLYAGAKIVRVIDDYRARFEIQRFDLTIDWGWFWFFTKPLFWLLEWLYVQIGNFGLSIMVLTVIVKALFFPLANKSYVAMSKMKMLQPEMEKLRERVGQDKQRMNQEMMALYKREKVNPAAGCLPILVQIPVFFALYKVLYTTIEMRHQPFFGWIQDLSAPDPLTILTLFGLVPWQIPEILAFFNIGLWPIIMGVTMYLQQMLNPQPTDPVQARVFQFLPILFTFMLAPFSAGLVIYWAWSNILSIAQQYAIMRRHGAPIGGKGGAVPVPAAPKDTGKSGKGGKKD